MKPAKYDLEIYEDSTFELPLTWGSAKGVPYDLTGYSAIAQIRANKKSDVVLIEMSTANGKITLTDPTNGKFTLKLLPADSLDTKWVKGVWDLKMITPGGDEQFLLYGDVEIIQTVTR